MIAAAAEIFAMVAATIGAGLGVLRWRARHVDEFRAVLFEMRDFFQGIVASGGATSKEFMDDQRRRDEKRLEDLQRRLVSPSLRRAAAEVLGAYRHTFGLSPPAPLPQISWGADHAIAKDQGYQTRRAETAEAAQATLDTISAVMIAVAKVERVAIGK
jgi:hypothetical protein